MRIDRIRVGGFGRLADLDTGPGLADLVVVLGPNEAGKSTLFAFLTTALYGFQPASRDRSPWVPWGTDEASGSVTLRLAGDGCAEVERRLRSQPVARLTIGSGTEELRNQPLPWVEHVPRTVFRQVFAVTLGDLAGLDEETWARIQDKVVGSMGAADLRSARDVAAGLEQEAAELWRPNRRGNQRIRAIQAEIRRLRGHRKEAADRDRLIRELVAERRSVGECLRRAREARQRDLAEVDTLQTLLPVRRALDRIAELRRSGGDRSELAGLPGDPVSRLTELEAEHARVGDRRREVEDALREAGRALERFDDRARRLVGRREEIARVASRAIGSAPDRQRATELEGDLADVESTLDAASADVLLDPWREVSEAILGGLSTELLTERIGGAEAAPEPWQGPSGPVLGTATALGLSALAWGATSGSTLAAVGGAALAGAAAAMAVVRRRSAGRAPGPHEVRDDVRGLLDGVRVRDELLREPGEALVSGLRRIQELLRQREPLLGALDRARARVAEADAATLRLARDVDVESAGDPEEVAASLEREAREADRAQSAGESAEREVRRLRAEHARLVDRLDTIRPGLVALRDAGTRLGSGDAVTGLEEARGRIAAHERADQLEEELERSHPDLEDIVRRLEESPPGPPVDTTGEAALARARAGIEREEETMEELLRRGEALESEVAHLRDLETVDSVDGEIASLREEERRLLGERDRKWVLAQLIREADRRFREEHQPDLLRRAGSYLSHLTAGRYTRLVVDETGDGDLFHLVGPGLPVPVALAPPVSTGTLEQAYLSLRLAIVDHLDHGAEKLPLFVDEVFVNWDPERRARGLEVLAGVAGARQVFAFTCHAAVARELESQGAQVVTLERGP